MTTTPEISPSYSSSRRLLQQRKQLVVKDGVLWRQFEDPEGVSRFLQLVVPQVLQEEVLKELHTGIVGGHLGEDKTIAQLKERFYWPGQYRDVKNFCQACPSCATTKTPTPKRRAPLGTIKAGYPMEIVALDIMGPLSETENKNLRTLIYW